MYEHYLFDASVAAVSVWEREKKKFYTVFYQTKRGNFKAVLLYDYQIGSGRILTFNISSRDEIPSSILNCKLANEQKECK